MVSQNNSSRPPTASNLVESPSSSPLPVSRLAARWSTRRPELTAEMELLDTEPEPGELNTVNSSGLFHTVSPDKMSVQYARTQQHGHDVGVVQADFPAPRKRIAYYFEMTVKNAGVKGQTAIGFTQSNFKMRRQPGWEVNSCGYHGDDGHLYRGQGKGESFGPTFTARDTIGAGINYATQEFFFTKNGKLVGTASKDIRGPLYPTIAVHSQNEEVTVNFGKQPFHFDIEAFITEERLKQRRMFDKLPLQSNLSHWIVRSYLLHYGYQDTLNSYDRASETAYPPDSPMQTNGYHDDRDTYALSDRKILRQLIKGGNIDSAFEQLRYLYPVVVQDDTSVICFLLHSQKFIEYVRVGQLENAINYARSELAKFYDMRPLPELLEDVVALLAYEDPSQSCVGYLLDTSQREYVADAVNAGVLSTNPDLREPEQALYSTLEKLLRQLTACSLERRTFDGEQGEAFCLHREVQTVESRKSNKS